jgi:hypothetical protein
MSFPRIYQSFSEFERDELRKLDSLRTTVEDMLEERFTEEMDLFEMVDKSGRRPARRRE